MRKIIKNKSKDMLLYRRIPVIALLLVLVINNTHAQQTNLEKKQTAIEKKAAVRNGQKKTLDIISLSKLRQKKQSPVENNKAVVAVKATYPTVKYGNIQKPAKPARPSTYTFTGKGQWSDAANWVNSAVPPAILQSGDKVVINGRGGCLFSSAKLFSLEEGSSVEVKEGAALYVTTSNNFILRAYMKADFKKQPVNIKDAGTLEQPAVQ
jgi:hypothetical protein